MSHLKNNFRLFVKKYFSITNILLVIFISLLFIPFILIFIFLLKRSWADGLSVAALLYICLSFLALVFNVAQFKTFNKLKKLFAIKKENNERLLDFEKKQMKLLNIKEVDEETKEQKIIYMQRTRFLSCFGLVYGIILLIISLPFLF